MRDIQAIVFDVVGVLSPDIIETKLIDLAKKYGKDPAILLKASPQYRIQADLGKISDREYWQKVLEVFAIKATEEDIEIDSYLTLIEESLELVYKLKANYKIAILSNDSKEMSSIRRSKFDFDNIFDLVLISYELEMVKPQLQIYNKAIQELQFMPQRCVFVDDRQENVDAANKAGLKAILFQSASQLQTELLQMGLTF